MATQITTTNVVAKLTSLEVEILDGASRILASLDPGQSSMDGSNQVWNELVSQAANPELPVAADAGLPIRTTPVANAISESHLESLRPGAKCQ